MTVLRPIKQSELAMIMQWRMREDITRYMNSDPVLTMEKQEQWFFALKEKKEEQVYMIEREDTPCGILNITDIDEKNSRCSWGYYVAVNEKRSLDLALALEWNLYDYVFDRLQLNKLTGEVFTENKGVIRMHQMCGSTVEGILKQHVKKNGRYYDVAIVSILREEWEKIRDSHAYEKIEFIR